MDAALLSNMVKDLILDNDSVTLKGLGRFVAKVEPSSFADRGFTINPPYRRLSFESAEGEDRLLEERFVALAGGDAASASKALSDFLSDVRRELEDNKVFVLPGLGRLRATAGNNFFLVADEDLDIYPEGFGLVPLSMRTKTETPEEVAAAVASLKDVIAPAEPEAAAPSEPAPAPAPSAPEVPVRKPRRNGRWLIAASITIVVLCGLFFGGLYALGRYAPDFIDSLLYSEEELQYVKMLW